MKEEIKGGLVLKLHDENYVKIGDMKIYLKAICISGTNGGRKCVELRFIGPKEVDIERLNR